MFFDDAVKFFEFFNFCGNTFQNSSFAIFNFEIYVTSQEKCFSTKTLLFKLFRFIIIELFKFLNVII